MNNEIKLAIEVTVEIPIVPNFLKVNGISTSVIQLTKEQLKKVGEMWTEKLIENAIKKQEESL